jgi:hypothetical protein
MIGRRIAMTLEKSVKSVARTPMKAVSNVVPTPR